MIWLILLAATELPPTVEQGSKIFAKSCATGYCHGAEGAAARGPRLRERQFEREYLVRVTRDGIPRSSMPAWKERLSAQEIEAVVDYIVHLNGGKVESSRRLDPSAVAAGPGRALFVGQCSSCHQANGLGLGAGPRLTAESAWPTEPKSLRQLTLKDGETFPAWIVSASPSLTVVLDLTDRAPIRRSLETSEIAAQPPAKWQHPPIDDADWGRIHAWLMLP